MKKTHSKQESTSAGKTIRLNKFLSNAGICSRREADEFIKMGLVQINGKTVTEMGYQVQSSDEVKYDGARIQQAPPVYLLLNKPKGFVATSQGGKINKSVQELIRNAVQFKVPPVGDMGRPMTGLLLFTNDEVLRKKLNNSSSIPMIYQVVLDQNITKEMMEKLKTGQLVFEKMQNANFLKASTHQLQSKWYRLVSKNMCLDHNVPSACLGRNFALQSFLKLIPKRYLELNNQSDEAKSQ